MEYTDDQVLEVITNFPETNNKELKMLLFTLGMYICDYQFARVLLLMKRAV